MVQPVPDIGFVGTGSMGGPMVERLLSAGVAVTLFARKPEVRERFAALEATMADSVAELAGTAGVLVLCPFSEEQVFQIMTGEGGLLRAACPGTVIVQHATMSAGGIRQLAEESAGLGVTELDAPVSGRAEDIRAGRLTVLVGGEADALARVEPLLRTYSDAIVHVGEAGAATTAKLVSNLTFAAQVQIAGAALKLAGDLGLSESGALEALTNCSARGFALTTMKSVGSADTFAQIGGPYLRKDVALAQQMAARLGVDTGLLGTTVRTAPFDLDGR
ncbi:NAD(P)-dependent oxidoreductase [Amycolatopsis thermoflava]|uniref:NAD(P)-dependent oxidoreductase n=1 Tax=Amycolatopsis thermoflava TaxID=84480 RepID=UPI0037FF09D2